MRESGDVLKTRPVSKQYKVVPGWNNVCSDAHNQAREAFVLWCVHGKPKTGPIFTCMSKSRALFKYALRHCKRVEKTFAADKLEYQLVNKDYNQFWQHVKTINGKQAPIAKNVGGCAGHLEIVDMWRTHFSGLLNNSKSGNDSKRVDVLSVINDHKAYNGKISIETHEVQSALNYLKLGKAAGPDKLYSEHFKYAGPTLVTLLSLLIKVIFVHGYMPYYDMMFTTIIPLLRANMLILRFSYCSTAVKRCFFQTFCTNFYCTQLWWSYTKSTLRKTKIAFNNSFRFLMRYDRFCSASGMFAEANVNNVDTVRRKCIFGFMCRLRESNNNIIKTLISQHVYTPTQSAIEWGRSLYIGSRSTYFD